MFKQFTNATDFEKEFCNFRRNKLKGFYFVDGVGDFAELNKSKFLPLARLGYFKDFDKKYFNNLIDIRGAQPPEVTIFIYNIDVKFKPLELLKFERSNISIIYYNEFEQNSIFGEFETPDEKGEKAKATEEPKKEKAKGVYELEPIPKELFKNNWA